MLQPWSSKREQRSPKITANASSRRGRSRSLRPAFELLEDRILLAGQVFVADVFQDRDLPLAAIQGRTSDLSLREALKLANVDAGRDTIRLSTNQTYTVQQLVLDPNGLIQIGGQRYALTGNFDITGEVTFEGNGATVDLNRSDRFFHSHVNATFANLLSGTPDVKFEDMTIINGQGTFSGGALTVSGTGRLLIDNVTFSRNQIVGNAGFTNSEENGTNGGDALGGAVYVNNAQTVVTFVNGRFEGNSVTGGRGGDADDSNDSGGRGGNASGGAVFVNAGVVVFENTAFHNNHAIGGQTGYTESGLAFHNQDFDYGVARGGAVYVQGSGQVTFIGGSLTSNSAQGRTGRGDFDDDNGENGGLAQGGAVYIDQGSGLVHVEGTLVQDNRANGGMGGSADDSGDQGGKGGHGQGGAFYLASGSLTVLNSTVTQNTTNGGQTGWTESGVKVGNARADSPVFYTNDYQPYGSSQGGAMYLAGSGAVSIQNSTLSGNLAQGRSGLHDFYDDNGEDAGKAQGGAVYVDMAGGTVTVSDGSKFLNNTARGSTGGNGDSGSNDLAGKGGDAQGGAVYLANGNLSVLSSEWAGNVAQAGQSGHANGGVAKASIAGLPPPTPQRDLSRHAYAEGGAVYAGHGSVSFMDVTMHHNEARGAAGSNVNEQEDGEDGGAGSGGAVFLYQPNSPVVLVNSTLRNNTARGGNGGFGEEDNDHGGKGGAGQGGAIFSFGSVTLVTSTLKDNLAVGGDGGRTLDGGYGSGGHGGDGLGGAVHILGGKLDSYDTSYVNNEARGGAGVYSYENRIGDGGDARGGAVYAVNTTVELEGAASFTTTISGNKAVGGNAGQFDSDGDTNGNTAGHGGDAQGGAVYQNNGSLLMWYAGLYGNRASGGQGSRGIFTSVLAGPPGGNSGSAAGGAVWNNGDLTLDSTVFSNNSAYGMGIGQGSTFTGGLGGVDDDGNGLRGGDGGAAVGGGVASTGQMLTIRDSVFMNNNALGGNGGRGGEGFGSGGPGGRGGDARGGAVSAVVQTRAQIIDSVFAGNTVVAGAGGVGGNGIQANPNGFNGGAGGNGGNAHGGGLDLTSSQSAEATIANSTFDLNRMAAGDGGSGGKGSKGEGGRSNRYGGSGGDGGDGGLVEGGGIYSSGMSVTMTGSTVSRNIVSAGWGGTGGGGGLGVLGGSGGDGGNAAEAHGGGVALGSGSLAARTSTVFGNLALAGYGGFGGDAADGKLYGGNGGDAGNGGKAYGGGVWAGPFVTVGLTAVTVANNGVEAGGAGLAGIKGQWQDSFQSNPVRRGYVREGTILTGGSTSIFANSSNPRSHVGNGVQAASFGAPVQFNLDDGSLPLGAEIAGGVGAGLAVVAPPVLFAAGGGLAAYVTLSAAAASGSGVTFVAAGTASTLIAGGGAAGVVVLAGTILVTTAVEAFIAGNGNPFEGLGEVLDNRALSPSDARYNLLVLLVGTSDDEDPLPPYDGDNGNPGAAGVASGASIWVDPTGRLEMERTIVADGKSAVRRQERGNSSSQGSGGFEIIIITNGHEPYALREFVTTQSDPAEIVAGQFVSHGHNFVDAGDGLTFQGSDLHGTTAAPLDLKSVGYLDDNGGPTQTLRLRPDSPARAAFTASGTETAQNGYVWNGTYDIGAWGGGVNVAPTAGPLSFTAAPGSTVSVPYSALIGAAHDANGDQVSVVIGPDGLVIIPIIIEPTLPPGSGQPLFANKPEAVTQTHTFNYTVPDHFVGNKVFRYTIDDGFLTTQGSFTITSGEVVIDEDAGPQNWSAGWETLSPAGEAVEVAEVSDSSLFSVAPTIVNGVLTFTPAADANGTVIVTVRRAGDADGPTETFTITIRAVNDAPRFTPQDVVVLEDAGSQTTTSWSTGVTAGGADEAGQVLTYEVVGNSNPDLFLVPPSLDAQGRLTFTANPNASGRSVITVRVSDNGGTDLGGSDTTEQSFTVMVQAVADLPTLSVNAVSGNEGAELPLDISSALTDLDGSEVLSVRVEGLPNGSKLSAGTRNADGSWTLTADELAGLTVTLPDDGSFTLRVTAVATETSNGAAAETSLDVVADVRNVEPRLTARGRLMWDVQKPYVLDLSSSDPGRDTIRRWVINWGDGTVQTVVGNPSSVSHEYPLVTRDYVIKVTAADEDGTYSVEPVSTKIVFTEPHAGWVADTFFSMTRVVIDAGRLQAWAGILHRAGTTKALNQARAKVLELIRESLEYRTRLVTDLYVEVAHREPTKGELIWGLSLFAKGDWPKVKVIILNRLR